MSRKHVTTQDCLSHRSIQSPHCHKSYSALAVHREDIYSEETRERRGHRVNHREPTGLPPRSAPDSPAVHRRLGSSTLIAHHSPTVSRKFPTHHYLRSRTWSLSSADSDSSEDKNYLMRRFLNPEADQQTLLERSRSVSPILYTMRSASPFYETAVRRRGDLERGDSDPSRGDDFHSGHITVRRSPCRSPGLRRRRIQEGVMIERDRARYGSYSYDGSEQFGAHSVGPEMARSFQEQQRLRGAGRRDPLAHQLSVSSGSSLDEAGYEQTRRVPLPAPARIFSPGRNVTTGTSVNPCPSPTRVLSPAKPLAQDNVDYTKTPRQAKVTLELPVGGLTVDPAPSPCPSPVIFRSIKEEKEEEGDHSFQARRSQSKSPRLRHRPEESRQLGHMSSSDETSSLKPMVIVGDVPLIQVLSSSPEKSELHHSPESAFREPLKDRASLEIARERRRQRRSQSRSPSPLIMESFRTEDIEPVTIGFRPISPTTCTARPLVKDPRSASPPNLTSSLSGAEVVRPFASPAVTDTTLLDSFPSSHESMVQQMKVLTLDLLRMAFLQVRLF